MAPAFAREGDEFAGGGAVQGVFQVTVIVVELVPLVTVVGKALMPALVAA
ncbi:MAG: hypothetical protein U1F68_19070 [Gammaproteobacteria bacterium]